MGVSQAAVHYETCIEADMFPMPLLMSELTRLHLRQLWFQYVPMSARNYLEQERFRAGANRAVWAEPLRQALRFFIPPHVKTQWTAWWEEQIRKTWELAYPQEHSDFIHKGPFGCPAAAFWSDVNQNNSVRRELKQGFICMFCHEGWHVRYQCNHIAHLSCRPCGIHFTIGAHSDPDHALTCFTDQLRRQKILDMEFERVTARY